MAESTNQSVKIGKTVDAQRLAYAEVLRHFMSGRMTNDEYEGACDRLVRISVDPAVHQIYDAAWHLYDDVRTHRMNGRRKPNRELRRRIALWILFLRSSDQPALLRRKDIAWYRNSLKLLLLVVGWLCSVAGVFTGVFMGTWTALQVGGALYFAGLAWAWMSDGVSLNTRVRNVAFRASDNVVWPFASQAELLAAARHVGYLGRSGVPHGD